MVLVVAGRPDEEYLMSHVSFKATKTNKGQGDKIYRGARGLNGLIYQKLTLVQAHCEVIFKRCFMNYLFLYGKKR